MGLPVHDRAALDDVLAMNRLRDVLIYIVHVYRERSRELADGSEDRIRDRARLGIAADALIESEEIAKKAREDIAGIIGQSAEVALEMGL